MKNILVTGFAPFGGESLNPSWEAVRRLPQTLRGYRLEKLELPVEFHRCAAPVLRAVAETKPAAVVCVGQAGGRETVTPERVAINWMDARIPDNGGFQPAEEKIVPDGPDAYFSTLPVCEMVRAMRAAGVPARLSLSAGAYVCNDLLYELLHGLAMGGMNVPAGFVHVPFAPQQVLGKAAPSLTLEQMTTALQAGLEAVVASLEQDT